MNDNGNKSETVSAWVAVLAAVVLVLVVIACAVLVIGVMR